MIKITAINVLYSNEAILEIDKIGVTLKNSNKKGADASLDLVIREKSGQDLLAQDFELFIGENKTAEYIIPLDVPITGNFPCEFRISLIIDGKVSDESEWRDLIEAEESDGSTLVDSGASRDDTEITVIQDADFEKEDEEDTETEIMLEEPEEIVVEKNPEEEEIKPAQPQQESWGILLEEGQDELYEEKIEGDIQPSKDSKGAKKKKKNQNEKEIPKKEDIKVKEAFEEKLIENEKIEKKKKDTEEKKDETIPIPESPVEKNKPAVSPQKEIAPKKEEVKVPIEESPPIEVKETIPIPTEKEQNIISNKGETTVEVNIVEPMEEELPQTLTEFELNKESSKEEKKTEIKKEKGKNADKYNKKKKRSPAALIIIIILVLGLAGSGYLFKDKLLNLINKEKKTTNEESLENLLSTEKDKSMENLLNFDEKAKFKIETVKITADQLDSIGSIIDDFGGEVAEKDDGYIIVFKPKTKEIYDKVKIKLRSLNIKAK
ncbi:hypothetical protein J7L48_04095 [bacterium]|nr:hypothetical protein [bacterium]